VTTTLLERTDRGLYCPVGGFYVDPWQPVEHAIITHAHSDHARWGSRRYLTAGPGREVLRRRVGEEAEIETLEYGETLDRHGVKVSLHPAGHILGSAQVRIEHRGQVAVVSGDYKTSGDRTCAPFEPIRCHLFVSECTFGLPIYRWRPEEEVFAEINAWWRGNQEEKRTSVIFAYALGKAQRVLSGLDPSIGPILVHGAVWGMLPAYRNAGVELPPVIYATDDARKAARGTGIVIAPPSANGTAWLRKFGSYSTGFASGWMQIRGARRRRAVDRGFTLSDHADFAGLCSAIDATGAETVWATHGFTSVLVRWLNEQGRNAVAVSTRFEGEGDDDPENMEVVTPEGQLVSPAPEDES
jgi:putative mRNA 3-end processing factor